MQRTVIRFGAFELDSAAGELFKRGVKVRLHDQACQLLLALVERPGEVVTRKELQERLWPSGTFVEFDHGLNNLVSRLRDALGDSADNPRFIETVPRRGYRFIAPVEHPRADAAGHVDDVPAPADRPALAEVPATGVTPVADDSKRARWSRALAAVAVAAVVILLAGLAGSWRRADPPPANAVAVLPFLAAGAGEDPIDEYLAFGMTDALISELSRFGGLEVISQTSAMRYKGSTQTLPEIARELGVGRVVEGSVLKEGDKFRITVQLIDAATDTHVWTQTYDQAPASAAADQRALAREVAALVRAKILPSAPEATPLPRRTNAAAAEAYLKGRYFMQRAAPGSAARARAFFEAAIAADPDYAPARVGLAHYFVTSDEVAPAEAIPLAEAGARRARELDDSYPGAYAVLAFVNYFGHWDWEATGREFERAIALDPNDAWTRRWHALYLSSMGRHATAAAEIERALELDPVSISAFDAAGAVWSNARRFDKVLEAADRILALEPADPRGFLHQAIGYFHQGRFADAVNAATVAADNAGRNPAFLCILAAAQQRAGLTDAALATLQEIEQAAETGYVPDAFLALAYLWLRDHDAAVDQLYRGFERRDGYLVVANVTPWLDPLREHPRFQALIARMNFPN